jgi:predicted tellurium resistance membrane protein TerC
MVLDIIFSLDSVITAVGMADDIEVMVTAVVIAIAVMLLFAKQIGDFVNKYPSMKILALSFLLLIGVLLTAEGLGQQINKGYIYFAMAFALMVELLNIRFRAKQEPA